MRPYFERLEQCGYVNPPTDPRDSSQNPGRHGFEGWLPTKTADIHLALKDIELLEIIASASIDTLVEHVDNPREWLNATFGSLKAFWQHKKEPFSNLERHFDPNDFLRDEESRE